MIIHRHCNYAGNAVSKTSRWHRHVRGDRRGLLACYYPFTQISRLISFQMGRINWFRLEHQARLIEMNYFPFLKGHLLSRCWMGRRGLQRSHCGPSRRCSWAAVNYGDSGALLSSLHLGRALIFLCTHPTRIRSKPSACSKPGERKSQSVSVP